MQWLSFIFVSRSLSYNRSRHCVVLNSDDCGITQYWWCTCMSFTIKGLSLSYISSFFGGLYTNCNLNNMNLKWVNMLVFVHCYWSFQKTWSVSIPDLLKSLSPFRVHPELAVQIQTLACYLEICLDPGRTSKGNTNLYTSFILIWKGRKENIWIVQIHREYIWAKQR